MLNDTVSSLSLFFPCVSFFKFSFILITKLIGEKEEACIRYGIHSVRQSKRETGSKNMRSITSNPRCFTSSLWYRRSALHLLLKTLSSLLRLFLRKPFHYGRMGLWHQCGNGSHGDGGSFSTISELEGTLEGRDGGEGEMEKMREWGTSEVWVDLVRDVSRCFWREKGRSREPDRLRKHVRILNRGTLGSICPSFFLLTTCRLSRTTTEGWFPSSLTDLSPRVKILTIQRVLLCWTTWKNSTVIPPPSAWPRSISGRFVPLPRAEVSLLYTPTPILRELYYTLGLTSCCFLSSFFNVLPSFYQALEFFESGRVLFGTDTPMDMAEPGSFTSTSKGGVLQCGKNRKGRC